MMGGRYEFCSLHIVPMFRLVGAKGKEHMLIEILHGIR